MCEAGDSGCIYTCDGDSCTVASSAFCAEGDEECVNFYNYYEDLADGQSNGEGNSANNVSANKASTLSVTKNVLFYLIPALFLALVIACWVRPRVSQKLRRYMTLI